MGFIYDYNFIKFIQVKIILFLVLFFMNFKTKSGFIYIVESIYIVFLVFPNLIIYEYVPTNSYIIKTILFFVFLLHISQYFNFRIGFRKVTEKQSMILILVVSFLVFLPFLLECKNNLNLNVLSFTDIYDVRKENSGHFFLFSGYLFSWLSKVILPILFVYSMIKRNFVISFITLFILLYLFVAMAHKSIFFGIFLVVFFYFFEDYKKKTFFFLLVIIIGFAASHFLYYSKGMILPESLLVRRVFFVPALLNTFYFDFFKNEPLYFSYSIFRNFVEYKHELPPANLIGLNYLNSLETFANNGFISDGYMNWGLKGTVFFAIILSFIFKLFDVIKIDSRYFGVFFLAIFTTISSALFTSLLTHGILLLIFLSMFVLQKNNYE